MLRENEIITADAVAKEYRLSEPIAREIVAEETQRALRRSWVAWLVFFSALRLAGYLYCVPGSDKSTGGRRTAWGSAGLLRRCRRVRRCRRRRRRQGTTGGLIMCGYGRYDAVVGNGLARRSSPRRLA